MSELSFATAGSGLGLLFLGALVAGLLAGLFGLGGGVVIVPLLFTVLTQRGVDPGLAMAVAINTSLASIVVTGLWSAFAHQRMGHIQWRWVRSLSPALILGSAAGGSVVAILRSPWMPAAFGVFLILVVFAKHKAFSGLLVGKAASLRHITGGEKFGTRLIALVIGFVSALVGIGGGTMTVPYLRFMGLSIRQAVGSSAMLGALLALSASFVGLLLSINSDGAGDPSFEMQSYLGLIFLPGLLGVLPGTLLMAPAGAKLSAYLPERLLDGAFNTVLLVLGLKMLLSAF